MPEVMEVARRGGGVALIQINITWKCNVHVCHVQVQYTMYADSSVNLYQNPNQSNKWTHVHVYIWYAW